MGSEVRKREKYKGVEKFVAKMKKFRERLKQC